MTAIKIDHICKVCSLVKRVDIDWQDSNGDTALIMAAKYDNGIIVRLLVAAGANVNVRNAKGETALSIAVDKFAWSMVAEEGGELNRGRHDYDFDIIELLIKAGADVNVRHSILQTLFQYYPVDMLIAAGADVNVTFPDETTLLMFAASVGDYNKVKALLEAGADPSATTSDGYTAADFGGKRIKKLILSYSEPIEHA